MRLLLTLGANASLVDTSHGNTALHWAILARNTTAISTLILKVKITHNSIHSDCNKYKNKQNESSLFSLQGKSSLDIANLRGDTPLKMLQVNAGSIWIGTKVMERIREESQSSQRKNFIVKLTLDKVSWLTISKI